MSQTLSVTEVARHFAEYVNRVAHRGECFVLVRGLILSGMWRNGSRKNSRHSQ